MLDTPGKDPRLPLCNPELRQPLLPCTPQHSPGLGQRAVHTTWSARGLQTAFSASPDKPQVTGYKPPVLDPVTHLPKHTQADTGGQLLLLQSAP
jgi:hypothetical protein